MADHDTHDHTGIPGVATIADIVDVPTAEMDDTLRLAPDGAGGVEWAAGAGAGVALSVLGYNTIGGSYEGMSDDKFYCTKITLSATSLIVSVAAYVKGNNQGGVTSFAAAVMADSSGPTLLLAGAAPAALSTFIDKAAAARWFHIPVGVYLAAGDYWIGFAQMDHSGSEQTQLAYDGSGSDVTFASGGNWTTEGNQYSNTTTSNKYSIRAVILS